MASRSVQFALTWTVHPARQSPGATVLTAGVIVALAVAAGALMESVWWGVLSVVLLLISLHRFFLPNRFVLDECGASAGTVLQRHRIHWSDVRRYDCGRCGVRLSSRLRPAAFAGGSSVTLLLKGNAAEVLTRIESCLRNASSDVVATAEANHAPPV
jgi:hypothetical protein